MASSMVMVSTVGPVALVSAGRATRAMACMSDQVSVTGLPLTSEMARSRQTKRSRLRAALALSTAKVDEPLGVGAGDLEAALLPRRERTERAAQEQLVVALDA